MYICGNQHGELKHVVFFPQSFAVFFSKKVDRSMGKYACSGEGRITKAALLAMMGYKKFSQQPLQELTLSEEKKERVMRVLEDNGGNYNKASVVLGVSISSLKRWTKSWGDPIASNNEETSPNPTRGFYEKIERPWRIRSFNPSNREVCIDIQTYSGVNHLSYTVPTQKTAYY